jgi:hypothetical protein
MNTSSKYTIIFFAVGLQLVASNVFAVQEEDSLFSSVDATAAFDSDDDEEKNGPASSVTNRERRLISTNDLIRTLQEGNFEASAIGTRAVATKKQIASWQFPVLVTLSENERDVTIVLGLRRVSDLQKVPAARLLQLLETNEKSGGTSYAFNRERNRLELFSLLENSGISGQTLRDEINRLAILARDTESLWNLEEAAGGAAENSSAPETAGATKIVESQNTQIQTKPVQPTSPATPEVPVTVAVPATSLHGKWSSSRSTTDAFAILLNADNTFVLVSVTGAKQAKSTGKFTFLSNQLTLEGSDGSRLGGTISLVSDSEFRFEPQSAGGKSTVLTFRKAQ